MSKSKLRSDKTCLNCNHVVAEKFCPNCGQENVDTRKTFHHLFIHFFEDLTHYENAFWKTIKNLLFKPSSLTKEYLSGKRLSYLAPVRLYIFISFITFFLISLTPDSDSKAHKSDTKKGDYEYKSEKSPVSLKFTETPKSKPSTDLYDKEQQKIIALKQEGRLTKKEADTLLSYIEKAKEKEDGFFYFGEKKYRNLAELDSIQKHGKASEKLAPLEYWITKKVIVVGQKYSNEELKEKFTESFQHNIPKVLFIFMPIFAFILWLFHNKKRWFYFDHGIFTLHYFSFILLLILLQNTFDYFMTLLFGENKILNIISGFIVFAMFVWMFIYFFKAHHRFYAETRIVSNLKSFGMFFINLIFIMTILFAYLLYTFINIH
jgi:hypothetical protein